MKRWYHRHEQFSTFHIVVDQMPFPHFPLLIRQNNVYGSHCRRRNFVRHQTAYQYRAYATITPFQQQQMA